MAGSINRIEQDIATLEEAIARIAQEFDQGYEAYLTAVGQAVRQQLVLASYHLCTQAYPEAFLALSVSERQKLQQGLRHLGKQAQQILIELPNKSSVLEPAVGEPIQADQEEQEGDELPINVPVVLERNTPERLLQWQESVEKGIVLIFRTLSKDANLLLQRSGILSQKVPEAVLEAASTAEASAEAMAGPPNLLHIMIETEDEEDDQSAMVTKLTALHLRLGEIEFADATVMSRRHQLRNLAGQLSSIRREYQKKLREKAIMQAESAWRSSWYED